MVSRNYRTVYTVRQFFLDGSIFLSVKHVQVALFNFPLQNIQPIIFFYIKISGVDVITIEVINIIWWYKQKKKKELPIRHHR